jgi:hypothetical protein
VEVFVLKETEKERPLTIVRGLEQECPRSSMAVENRKRGAGGHVVEHIPFSISAMCLSLLPLLLLSSSLMMGVETNVDGLRDVVTCRDRGTEASM